MAQTLYPDAEEGSGRRSDPSGSLLFQYQKAASAMAHNQRGLAQLELNQPLQAIEHLNEAIQLDSRFAAAYINRALAYTLLGRNAEAERDVERAAELGGIELGLLKLSIGEAMEKLNEER